jgi:hypothetical protein
MEAKSKSPELIEKIGRFFLFRAVVYLLPVMYAIRLVLMIVTPEAYHMPGWQTVLWQGARDSSLALSLLAGQRYGANYTERRASSRLRRTDAWQLAFLAALYLSLEMPPLLELPWVPVALVCASGSIALYPWELRQIKRLEQVTARPLANNQTGDGLTR